MLALVVYTVHDNKGCVYRYTTGVGIDIRFIRIMVFGDTTFLMNEIGSHVLYCIYSPHREPMAKTAAAITTYGCELQGYIHRETHTTESRGAAYYLLGVCAHNPLLKNNSVQPFQQQKHRHGTPAAHIQGAGLRLHQRGISQTGKSQRHTLCTTHRTADKARRNRPLGTAARTDKTA